MKKRIAKKQIKKVVGFMSVNGLDVVNVVSNPDLRNEQNKPLRGTIRVEVDGFYYYIELLPL